MSKENNLVWLDLEMTGLDPEKQKIIEIAVIITDPALNIVHEGPDLIVHQTETVLKKMEDWPRDFFTENGLLEKVRASRVTTREAERQVMAVLKEHCVRRKCVLAGNTVWQDREFLRREMPKIIDWVHYRLVDVTSVRELVTRWYPNDPNIMFEKKDVHRAMADIKESIAELKHYRQYFFINTKDSG